jgi:hypothetical protein
MCLRTRIAILLFLTWPFTAATGQAFRFVDPEASRVSLYFEVSQNLIVIPARINQSSPLSMVLDSGISNTIITGLAESDTIPMNVLHRIKVGGLGDGTSIEAFYAQNNLIEIGNREDRGNMIEGDSLDIYLLANDEFELSRQLGIKVNGLVGSELFEHYLVSIDHINKKVTFHDREKFNFKRGTRNFSKIPLRIVRGKPFLDMDILQDDGSMMTVRLLIDTGASLSFWIAPVADSSIIIPDKTVRTLIGQGLNGAITGVNGRVRQARIGPFAFRNPLVSYPDSSSVAGLKLDQDRHGSLGNDVLRRFTAIFDFQGSALYLKPNKWFHSPFHYNRSGMEVEKIDPMIPIYSIYNIIDGSPAAQAGLKPGDLIEYINNIPAIMLKLDDINDILYGSSGNVVNMTVDRNREKIKIKLRLEAKI